MKLPQQVGAMSGYVTAAMPFLPLGGVTASPVIGWQRLPPPVPPPPAPVCHCVPHGHFFVPAANSCPTLHTQCYNDGTCACVNAPPPHGGFAQNQQHVYNAISQII